MKKQPKAKKWIFDEWFSDLHYPCPGGEDVSTPELKKRAARALKVSDDAAALYKERFLWEEKRTAALCAWNLKEQEKLRQPWDKD